MKTMKKITLTRNGQTSPRDTEVSTMHADGLAVGQVVMLRIKGDMAALKALAERVRLQPGA